MLAVVTLRNRTGQRRRSLCCDSRFGSVQPVGGLDCTAPTDEAGHGEKKKKKTDDQETVKQACDRKFTGSNLSVLEQWFLGDGVTRST